MAKKEGVDPLVAGIVYGFGQAPTERPARRVTIEKKPTEQTEKESHDTKDAFGWLRRRTGRLTR